MSVHFERCFIAAMKALVIVCTLFFLFGCASWDSVKAGVRHYGGQYEREKLKVAEFGVCVQPRVGVVLTEFKGRMDEWALFCEPHIPNAAELKDAVPNQ